MSNDQPTSSANLATRVVEAGKQAQPLIDEIYRAAYVMLVRINGLRGLSIQNVLTLAEPMAKEMADLFGRVQRDPYHVVREIRRLETILAERGLIVTMTDEPLTVDLPSESHAADAVETREVRETHTDGQEVVERVEPDIALAEATMPATPVVRPPSDLAESVAPVIAGHWLAKAHEPKPPVVETESRVRRFRISIIGAELFEAIWEKTDDEAVKHMRFRASANTTLRAAVRTDLTRIALHRVGLQVSTTTGPSPRAEEIIRRLGLKEISNWTRLVNLAVDAKFIKPDHGAWFLDPRAHVAQGEEPALEPPATIPDRTRSLLVRTMVASKPEAILSICLSDDAWAAEVRFALEGLFAYRQMLREGGKLPLHLPQDELRTLANELRLMNNQAGAGDRWNQLVHTAFTAEVIDRKLYHTFTHQPIQLEGHRNTCEFLRGVLGVGVEVAPTLWEAAHRFYEPSVTGWDTKVRFVLNIGGKTPQPLLVAGIRSIEETAKSHKDERGFLSRLIREMVEGFDAARRLGPKFTERYPDGMGKEAARTYEAVGAADDANWKRFITALGDWGVLWPNEVTRYLTK